jgi:hypothetical protein
LVAIGDGGERMYYATLKPQRGDTEHSVANEDDDGLLGQIVEVAAALATIDGFLITATDYEWPL